MFTHHEVLLTPFLEMAATLASCNWVLLVKAKQKPSAEPHLVAMGSTGGTGCEDKGRDSCETCVERSWVGSNQIERSCWENWESIKSSSSSMAMVGSFSVSRAAFSLSNTDWSAGSHGCKSIISLGIGLYAIYTHVNHNTDHYEMGWAMSWLEG